MKTLGQKTLFTYGLLTALLALAQSSATRPLFLKLPGGAVFKNPKTLVIPEGATWALQNDVHLKIDRIEINGTIYTRGKLLSIYANKIIFGENGVIKTFDSPAPNSDVVLPIPGAPGPAADQGSRCAVGHTGTVGNPGKNADHDPKTDGLKNPQPINIFAAEVSGIVKIDSVGQAGGKGTKGGKGSQGGQGGRGGKAKASKGLFGLGGGNCDGGAGGQGGNGGIGGNGGAGGIGGPAPKVEFIVANIRTEQNLSANISLRAGSGGAGGDEGDGGDAGLGGAGGAGDSATPIIESGWGNKNSGGGTGPKGAIGAKGLLAGIPGSIGPTPLEDDRALDVLQALESFRSTVFTQWQAFHWHRHLLAHVQDSFRLVQKRITTREVMETSLKEDAAIFAEYDKRHLARIKDAWQKAFIQPIEATLKNNVQDQRTTLGLKMAYEVLALLDQLDQNQDLMMVQKSVNEILYGDQGVMSLNREQIAKAAEVCAKYNQERSQTKFKSDHMGLYFRIPSCEGEPDFTQIKNINAPIILANNIENDFQPKQEEDALRENFKKHSEQNTQGIPFLISKLGWAFVPVALAQNAEHPISSVKLMPFSVTDIKQGMTSDRDESLGIFQRLEMKKEEEIWANNFYQELRAFAITTGAKQ